MKAHLLGVNRRFGTSQRTNNRYDMARLIAMTEQRPSTSESNTYQVAGFRAVEFNLDPEAFAQFAGLNYPCEVDLETEGRPSANGMDTYVIGIKQK